MQMDYVGSKAIDRVRNQFSLPWGVGHLTGGDQPAEEVLIPPLEEFANVVLA